MPVKKYNPESTNGKLVSNVEIADWLDVSPAATSVQSSLVKKGTKYLLKESIQSYCRHLRSFKKTEVATNLNDELTRWKIESEKRKDAEWRRAECREMCEGLIAGLRDDLSRLRDMLAELKNPNVTGAVEQLLQDLDGIQPDDIVRDREDEG